MSQLQGLVSAGRQIDNNRIIYVINLLLNVLCKFTTRILQGLVQYCPNVDCTVLQVTVENYHLHQCIYLEACRISEGWNYKRKDLNLSLNRKY